MNLLDNVKNKLGFGGDAYDDEYDDYDEYDDEYENDYEDDYGDDYDEPEDDRGARGGVASWPNSLNSSSRRESRTGESTPLVSSYDVRSTSSGVMQQRNTGNPDYDSVMQNYRIESRDSGARPAARTQDQLRAAREELNQLQRGVGGTSTIRSGIVTPANRRIVTVVPSSYNDAVKITAALRGGSSAAVSFKLMNPALAKRLLDFCFGVVSMTGGSVEKIAPNVFFLSRNGQPMSEQDKQQIEEAGLL